LGYTDKTLAEAIYQSVDLIKKIRDDYEDATTPIVIEGAMGPRADGYIPKEFMTAEQAQEYHSTQIGTFVNTDVDFVTAFTLTYVDEAVGIVNAAKYAKIPVAISFTLETDGRPGTSLVDAIEQVDTATGGGPDYYMINCVHPIHFRDVLASGEPQLKRIRGLMANASSKSHQELNEATELDEGNPVELAEQLLNIKKGVPWVNILAAWVNILAGCCGTDTRLAKAVAKTSSVNSQD
jgi:S-methylmethionine-dependent homocysteine/selenocysteine methylase